MTKKLLIVQNGQGLIVYEAAFFAAIALRIAIVAKVTKIGINISGFKALSSLDLTRNSVEGRLMKCKIEKSIIAKIEILKTAEVEIA
jgi:hypothetical protein